MVNRLDQSTLTEMEALHDDPSGEYARQIGGLRDKVQARLTEYEGDEAFAATRFCYSNMAAVAEQFGRPAEAIDFLKSAVAVGPDFLTAHQRLAELLEASGDTTDAEMHRERVAELNIKKRLEEDFRRDIEPYLDRYFDAERAKDYAGALEALDELKAIVDAHPNRDDIREPYFLIDLRRAQCFEELGNIRGQIDALESSLITDPVERWVAVVHKLLAVAYDEIGDAENALRCYREVANRAYGEKNSEASGPGRPTVDRRIQELESATAAQLADTAPTSSITTSVEAEEVPIEVDTQALEMINQMLTYINVSLADYGEIMDGGQRAAIEALLAQLAQLRQEIEAGHAFAVIADTRLEGFVLQDGTRIAFGQDQALREMLLKYACQRATHDPAMEANLLNGLRYGHRTEAENRIRKERRLGPLKRLFGRK